MRAPMTIINKLCKRKVSQSSEAQHWYQYLPNILLLNAWDLTAVCCNGADFDGDIMLTTDSVVYLNYIDAAQMAIMCEQRTAVKVVVAEDDVVQSNILSFGDQIGFVTNVATSGYDARSLYSKNSQEYMELSKRLAYCQKYQQDCIID